jgi:hypothetical protein
MKKVPRDFNPRFAKSLTTFQGLGGHARQHKPALKRRSSRNRELIGDWGLKWGLRPVSCANLQVLRCHPCACKLLCINFPLNS